MSVSFVSFRIARILSRESACRILSSCTCREPNRHRHQQGDSNSSGQAQSSPRGAPRDTAPPGAAGMKGVKEHKLNLCPRMGGRKTQGNESPISGGLQPPPALCVLSHVQSLGWKRGDVQSKPSPKEHKGAAQHLPWSLSRSQPKCSWSKHPIPKFPPCFAAISYLLKKGPSRTVVKPMHREHN